ncbi:histidinol dehydrogenase [Thecamonas trahens ATCC 50062]|uniref:Histidinol dehydrogenase n=1 Tax=Thecamonas trahens ATCC 50062 TaxID=461836 RepID=A0A0L0D985_THETB|nr:histidinol dehydrogenase [Thecamonas trahens ATCC 50062]KNC48800.1 histidinol dehydrogenase [Thecamonas trahens ATCC 50062]|eukprot:XP_013762851.1 histidinol dehydrogenase [Thecamonas trahens ATCC 50062]
MDTVIVCTGVANVASVAASLKRAGAKPRTSIESADVASAPLVVIPGVGTFGASMDALASSPGLIDAIKARLASNLPTLFVCVGLQILAACSDESPGVNGLGVLASANVVKFDNVASRPIPQQGWAKVKPMASAAGDIISRPGYAFFSNSFCLRSVPLGWSAAIASYGSDYVAALQRGNVLATQFHPELSGSFGLAILKAFVDLARAPLPVPDPIAPPHTRRIIPCLDCKDGRVVKGVQFEGLRDAGDPVELARAYEAQGADELVILDISATPEARATALDMIRSLRASVLLPMTVGGGVRSVDSAQALLEAGADKIAVNTAAVRDPALISRLASRFGSQCIVIAVDARSADSTASGWEVVVKSGSERTGIDAIEWAARAAAAGAGEILLTSFDRDGTRSGYDTKLLAAVSAAVSIPVVASGGASSPEHMVAAIAAGADALLAASIFHYGDYTVGSIKSALSLLDPSLSVRPPSFAPDAATKLHLSPPPQAVVPSIDLMGGRAVQLVGGDPEKLKIDAGSELDALAAKFALAGEIAVIDLDAALSRGSNKDAIVELCKRYPCRVGGGIRSVDAALDYLQAGARSVIIGTAASPELLAQLPRDRVLVALDAVHGEVVVDGWTTKTGESVADRVTALAPYCSGFLVTFVEREGRMVGIDRSAIADLVAVIAAASTSLGLPLSLTIAGGITSPADLADLYALGAMGQVGMSLYSGELSLGDAIAAPLVSDRADGLFPTVVVDCRGQLLGQVYSSKASIRTAVDERAGVYWSRSRGLWRKGASSGATQTLHAIALDCDADALTFVVSQDGNGFCHVPSRRACFAGVPSPGGSLDALGDLYRTLVSRLESAPQGSYTKKLFDKPSMLAAKIEEEAGEYIEALAAQPFDPAAATWEAADVLYFVMVGLVKAGIPLVDVERHLASRSLYVKRRGGAVKPKAAPLEPAAVDGGSGPSIPAPAPTGSPTPALRQVAAADVLSGKTSAYVDAVDAEALKVARSILARIEADGESALLELATKFGDLSDADEYWRDEQRYVLGPAEFAAAYESIPEAERKVLRRCAGRIETFALAQKQSLHPLTLSIAGGDIGHSISPVTRAGCYAPGGRYPLPSTVLMTAVTARVAGCADVIVASPHPAPIILAACHVAKVDKLLTIGGAQAIGAMAYGAGAVPACDAIVGPGSKWVTAAKSLVAGSVAIDMLAGPSECLVLADASADPGLIAADLLAQAEHDVAAVPILVTPDACVVDAVNAALASQIASGELGPNAATATTALANNGFSVIAANMDEAVAVANALAPEHLEIQVDGGKHDLARLTEELDNYGSLFVGAGSAEVLGDYSVGVNHTLPTGGSAKAFGGLSVLTFLRVRTFVHMTDMGAAGDIVADAVALASMEGLLGHAAAAKARLALVGTEKSGSISRSRAGSASAVGTAGVALPAANESGAVIKFALPKGRMNENILSLLADGGIKVKIRARSLRPSINLDGWDVKLLKPRDTVRLIQAGKRDMGFAGVDLIAELEAGGEVVPYFATGMDPVRVVVAAPDALLAAHGGSLPTDRKLVIATEYVTLTKKWIADTGLDASYIKTGGATEVYVPDDADVIIDNTATGETLKANRLSIIDVIMTSETYLVASKAALADPVRKAEIDRFVLLLKSALDGRSRVMIEFNVDESLLEDLIPSLPALKNPTVAQLYGGHAFAVRTAVQQKALTTLIPQLKMGGASDIVVTPIQQLIL